MSEPRHPLGQDQHGADLAGRAAGIIQEGQQFGCAPAFKPLSDVVADGQPRPLKLVGQIALRANASSCVRAKIRSASVMPACQTGSSSKRVYFMSAIVHANRAARQVRVH